MTTTPTDEPQLATPTLHEDFLQEAVAQLEVQYKRRADKWPAISSVLEVVKDARGAQTTQEFFALTCRLSHIMQALEPKDMHMLIANANLYALLPSAILTNPAFIRTLAGLIEAERGIYGEERNLLHVDEKMVLNTGLLLAFLPVALAADQLTEVNITFIRSHISRIMREQLRRMGIPDATVKDVAFWYEHVLDHFGYHPDAHPPGVDFRFLNKHLQTARSLAGVSFLCLTIGPVLSEQFKTLVADMAADRFSLTLALNNVHGAVYRIEEGMRDYSKDHPWDDGKELIRVYTELYIKDNERNLLYFVREVCSDFPPQPQPHLLVLRKMQRATAIAERVRVFGHKHLKAFREPLGEKEVEWTNKVYLITMGCLSSMAEVHEAQDELWKISVARRALTMWVTEVHQVLNKRYLEDEFHLLREHLRDEGVTVEWKSTLCTATKEVFTDPRIQEVKNREVLEKTVRTMLGMMNTDGGTLVIGLVERPDEMARDDLRAHMIVKEGRHFYNIGHELAESGKSLDQVRLQMLQILANITQQSTDKFNGLFAIELLQLRSDDKLISVTKISVTKAPQPFFSVKEERGVVWVSLVKRGPGQTIEVDPREYLTA